MSLGSSPNVSEPAKLPVDQQIRAESSEALGWIWRLLLAIALGLVISLAVGAAAWSTDLSAREPAGLVRGPYSDDEIHSVETQDEAKIRDLRNQEITQLRIALGRRSPTNRRADLYFRLAEIYLEAYHSEYVLEGRVHDKRIEKGVEDKFIDHTHSRPNLVAGIKACKEVLSFGIPYPKMDQILYFLGFNYGELDDRKESLHYYDELTRKFPDSPFVSEAYRALGDDAYEAGNFRKAQAYYETAVKKGNNDTLPRIYHKLAWSYYRTKQFDRAIETMKEAITRASQTGEKFLNLREEALRDMAIFMTETGKVDDAIAYFQSVAGDKSFYPKVLEKLGKQYERNVEPVKATVVYESLLKTHPSSEEAFRVLVKLVDLDLRRGHYMEALKRLGGVQIPKSGESDTMTAAQNLRAMVRRTATEHHEAYRKKGNKADLEVAEAYYQAYLGTFLAQDDPRGETPEIQMYLAEVKRDLGNSAEASALYRKVLESKDKRYAKEAGALWTASLAEAIKKAPPRAKATEPSDLENEFVDAADRLQEALGETNEGREAALRAAQVLAGYSGTRKDAIKRIRKIIEKWPGSVQAVTAARLWLQLYADQPDQVDDLKDTIKEVGSNTALMAADAQNGGKLKSFITDQETRLKISTIAQEEKTNDFSGAAKGYESFAADSPTRDLAEKAYANAVTSWMKAGDAESIDRVGTAWLKRYPKSAKAIDSLRASATQLLIQGRFDLAARIFEKLGHEAGDADSMETAARILEGNGDIARSEQVRAAYLELFPKSASRWSVLIALARSQEQGQQDGEAAKSYKTCMTGPPEIEAECGARLADLYLRGKDLDGAKATYKRVAAQSIKKSVSPYVAYARFKLADLMEQDAKFEPLALPEANLKKALNQRLEFLEPLSKAYQSAMEAGGPWGIAALDRLALFAQNFANEVDAIAAPAGAAPEAVAKFRKNLEGISAPLRKKAVTTWSEGYARALSAEVLSPALPEVADRLADARAATPGRAQGVKGRLRLAGVPADGGADGRTTALQKVRDKLGKNAYDPQAWVDYGNLLWGTGKPLLAKVAYEHALALNNKNPSALNNRAVVVLSGDGEEDWITAAEGSQLFADALKQDDFFLPAKINRASLLNYYRLFAKAKPLWEQSNARAPSADLDDGQAIATQGAGDSKGAEALFRKATSAGLSESRFANLYHQAARESLDGASGADKCLKRVNDIDVASISGFEKGAVEHLRRTCSAWKGEK